MHFNTIPTAEPVAIRARTCRREQRGLAPWRSLGLDMIGASDQIGLHAMSSADPKKKEKGDVELLERPTTRQPRRFQVVLHNDDYTTMEFVILVLVKFFHKTETEATQIMLHVHHRGYGVVGLFTRDIAETKASQVMDFAKQHGHPLRCTAEPEGFDGKGESE